MAGDVLADARSGKNGRHALAGLFRQSAFGRLAGYEDVNERLERPLRLHCYHALFVFNQFGDLERCALRAGNVHSADGWDDVLKPVMARYQGKVSHASIFAISCARWRRRSRSRTGR
jgi:hypothetical protein